MTIKRRGLHLLMVLLLLTMAMPSLAQGRKVKPAGNIQSKKVSSTQVGLFCHRLAFGLIIRKTGDACKEVPRSVL